MFPEFTAARADYPANWAPSYERVVIGFRVIDADTVELIIDQGFHDYRAETFRLPEFDAYETRGPNRERGREASSRLVELLTNADAVKVVSIKNPRGETAQGKYGRYIAELFIYQPALIGGWVRVTSILAAEGFEKP